MIGHGDNEYDGSKDGMLVIMMMGVMMRDRDGGDGGR